jgi:hypothetical protein
MKLRNSLLMTSMAVMICTATPTVLAQDNGGDGGGGGRRFRGGPPMDPAEMQQRVMENIRDHLNVTNNDEWQVMQGRVQKVLDARRDLGPGGNFGRMFFGRRGGPPGGPDGNADRPRRGGGFFGGSPSPELEALDKAIDSNAPTEQIKSAMQRYRDSRKAKEAAVEKAQADLKQLLTVKQEAAALSLGLVN